MENALAMSNITKTFGGVPVLIDVDFTVGKGEIHALIGENGAGKSTLMNILGGVIPRDKGEIELFGEKVEFHTPAEALAKGIAFVHQELNVVNDLTVYENLFLGHELKGKFGKLNKAEMIRRTVEIFERIDVEVDPTVMVRDLQATYKQIIEIAKSVLFNAKLVIMDEPTTSLTQHEVENVFRVMKNLTEQHGVTIIFISHKLKEVVEFCDTFTVLRNGEVIGTQATKTPEGRPVDQADIARMMVGRDVINVEVYKERKEGDILLSVKDLHVPGHVNEISFDLHRGEILGITGLLGDGKEELARAIFGDIRYTSGTMELRGKRINPKQPAAARKFGIGMLPANRKENAIIKDLTVAGNMTIVTLPDYRRGPTLIKSKEYETATLYKERLNIKVQDLHNLIGSLSGGNQQKVVLAKWLIAKPDVMLLCNPTQGVDVGAKNEIYNIVMELAGLGMGIIVTTGEAAEAARICDRLLVMYHGNLQGELDRNNFSEESIMILSTGGHLN
ncbi:MAG: sugar ABC transporter ATP-binding protein [Clostridiales Family XIII bacterium]|jgi:ribose transport system ATP-binding protein|nr:sugar ABC transporter ATP-binding protein [Clostridiales Family XIII bacterium]